MIAHVYRPKRRRAGQAVVGRMYRARIRFEGERRTRDIALKVTEQRSAEQRLRQLLTEHDRECTGLVAPKRVREAAETPLVEHLADYLADLGARGRVGRYVGGVRNYLHTLADECGWKLLQDITAESFLNWRKVQKLTPKTLNEYLVAARAFLKWAVRVGLVVNNALERVEMARVQGRQKRVRRSLTGEECQRLLGVAGPRKVVYLIAVLTGLRRGELRELRWADVELSNGASTVTVRASVAKNHREARLPLHPDAAEALQHLRPVKCNGLDLIFAGKIPRMKRFRADLKAAGIDGADNGHGRVDFHSLRVTYCTQLAGATPSERVRMELLRHHDPRLTAETYTDARLLPLAAAVGKLIFHRSAGEKGSDAQRDTQRDAQTGVQASQRMSASVTVATVGKGENVVANTGEKSLGGSVCHGESPKAEWCAMQDLNLRPPVCDTDALPAELIAHASAGKLTDR